MNRLILATASLALCAPLFSQSYITTPKGGLTNEGPQYAYLFGWYSDGHFQQADGTHKGSAKTLLEIAFRLDHRPHTSLTATGRTWSSISLDISETSNFDKMGRTWANNVTSSPTKAFNAKWTWPSQVGTPLLTPDVWGGIKGQLRFPFATPWVYTGKDDMLMEYKFNGGVLANNGTWSSRRGAYYYLDSENINTVSKTGIFVRHPTPLPRCNDSAITFRTGAYTYGGATTYGASGSIITLRNTLVFSHYSYFTAPQAPVIQALGFGGSSKGVHVGANCNLLYVDTSKPMVLMTFKTLPPYGYSGQMGWAIPWNSSLANTELWLQSGWADSKTNVFSLTAAAQVTMPNGLPPASLPRYKTLYNWSQAATTGFGPYTSGYYFPFCRYKCK